MNAITYTPVKRLAWALLGPSLLTLQASALDNVRSIRITNTRADWFYLEELRILNAAGFDVASLAFGTTATSSETPGFLSSIEGPIDDVRGDCCASGWHSSSSAGQQAYTLTLPEPLILVGEITVWDRADACCSQRLDGMLFEFFDGPDGSGDLLAAKQVDRLAADSLGDINLEAGASFSLPNPDADSDGDGLLDRYEEANGLDPDDPNGEHGGAGDPDQDGSSNLEEFERGTDPQNPDTDADGLMDGAESATGQWVSDQDTGTDPLNPDSDGDTLLDGVENRTGLYVDPQATGTDPLLIDSDGDGIRDHRELFHFTDPNDADSRPVLAIAIEGVQSVRFTNAKTDWFYIEELSLYNTDDRDVLSTAFGTTAVASEDPAFGGHSAGPIDDLIGVCCANGFHSSTDQGGQMLTYTFPMAQALTGDLSFWNRADACCAERMDAILVEYFSGPEATGELLAEHLIEGLGTERTDELNLPEGASVPVPVIAPTAPIQLTVLPVEDPDTLLLRWNSHPVEFFPLEHSNSLTPGSWTLLAEALPAAAPPEERTEWIVSRRSPNAQEFYRIRRVPPPPILRAGFEDGEEPWLTETSDVPFPTVGETRFERGTPDSGPGTAHSGSKVMATRLSGIYDDLLNLTLTSLEIDLTAQRRATLSFWYTLEAGLAEGARLEFIEAEDPTVVLAQTDPLAPAERWTRATYDLAEITGEGSAVTGKRFRLRFRFLADDNSADNGAGFYLDDVLIER